MNQIMTANNVTREVFLTDANLNLVDALGHKFYAFDGVDAQGNIVKRQDLNHNAGFEEGTEAFATDFRVGLAETNAAGKITNIKAYKLEEGKTEPTDTYEVMQGEWKDDNTGNIQMYANEETKTRKWVAGDADATKVIVTLFDALSAVSSKGFDAMPAGIMIQLPKSVGTTEVITVEFTLEDVFGVTKTLKVDVQANI